MTIRAITDFDKLMMHTAANADGNTAGAVDIKDYVLSGVLTIGNNTSRLTTFTSKADLEAYRRETFRLELDVLKDDDAATGTNAILWPSNARNKAGQSVYIEETDGDTYYKDLALVTEFTASYKLDGETVYKVVLVSASNNPVVVS